MEVQSNSSMASSDAIALKKLTKPEDIIQTKPNIIVMKTTGYVESKLILPPSTCGQTLHERFTKLLCHIAKREIEPGFEEYHIPNTLMGRLNRLRLVARIDASPYIRPPKASDFNKGPIKGYKGSLKLPPRSSQSQSQYEAGSFEPQPHPVVPGEPGIYAKYIAIRLAQSTYVTGPPKSKEELDNEIEEYFQAAGGRKPKISLNNDVEMHVDEDDEGEAKPVIFRLARANSMPPSSNGNREEANLFSKFLKTIKVKAFNQDNASLDKDLDDYFKSRGKTATSKHGKDTHLDRSDLDDDLENYRRQDPRLQQTSEGQSEETIDEDDVEVYGQDEDFEDL